MTGSQAGRRSRLPDASELAELIREGETVEELALTFDCSAATVRSRLNRAGYSTTAGTVDEPPVEDDHPLRITFEPQPWADDALCSQVDPEIFHPEKGGSTREAKAVCSRCTVAAECLTYALDHQERFGVWGGLSERERRALLKYQQQQRTPPAGPANTDAA